MMYNEFYNGVLYQIMKLEDILNRIDELNSMCDYNCYYDDCGIDCSHTECYKNRYKEMSILDKALFELL